MQSNGMPAARLHKTPAAQLSRKSDARIDAAVSFAHDLYQVLSSNPHDAPRTNELVERAKKHIDALHLYSQGRHVPGISGDPDIDRLVSRLWNICTRLRREPEPEPDLETGPREEGLRNSRGRGTSRMRKLFLHGRVLAFHLLSVVRTQGGRQASGVIWLLKLVLKAARDCIDGKETGMATGLLQKAADFKGSLQDLSTVLTEDDVEECTRLEVEYFILRTALAWIEDRIDVAEHMFTKAERLFQFLTPEFAERLAEVLYEVGKTMNSRSDFAMAIKWLERANSLLLLPGIENLSREGVELRLAILQALVTALLGADEPDSLDRAKSHVDSMESEVGRKLVVLLLRLELLQNTPAEVFDSDAYTEILRRIIKSFNYTESAFKLIIHHIRKLHDKSPGSGCTVLDDFILALSKADNMTWMEKAVVTRMWMITNQRDTSDTINAIYGVLSHLSRPLSAEAAVAAQALIWKKLEFDYGMGEYDLTERWCRLSLHAVFKNSGPGNISKLERKLLLCALSRNNSDDAMSIIQGMSPNSWKEPMTAYLIFKVAIRVQDHVLAEQCLETIGETLDHIDYLGACISESQKVGDAPCAVAALKKLQEKYEYKEPNPIYLPALFRCTIRLLSMFVGRDPDQSRIAGELCEQFGAVVLALKRQKLDSTIPKHFTVTELEWFGRNAYNLALKNTTTWELRQVAGMLTACVDIISHFPPDMGVQNDMSLKSVFARFIASSALVSLARAQDNVEKQQQDYHDLRTHVEAFDGELVELLPHVDEQCKEDLVRKHAALLAFDFEAAVALGQWGDLGGILQRAAPCGTVSAYQAMADSLLRGKAPGQILYSTMRKIINEIWGLEKFDALKLAKYTRCLFQATLPLDDTLAMKLLDEACSKARELHEGNASWPEVELEWMATTAFNHGIDCYGSQEVERAKEWLARAITLSHYCNGDLERALQEKYVRLNFDDGCTG